MKKQFVQPNSHEIKLCYLKNCTQHGSQADLFNLSIHQALRACEDHNLAHFSHAITELQLALDFDSYPQLSAAMFQFYESCRDDARLGHYQDAAQSLDYLITILKNPAAPLPFEVK